MRRPPWIHVSRYGRLRGAADVDWLVGESVGGAFQGDSNYGALSRLGDGRIVYGLDSKHPDGDARLLAFDPETGATAVVAELSKALGLADSIPHGKVHVPLFEHAGDLYTGTHVGVMSIRRGHERPGTAEGRRPYPGGRLVRVNLASGAVEELAQAPEEEGLIAMAFDGERGRIAFQLAHRPAPHLPTSRRAPGATGALPSAPASGSGDGRIGASAARSASTRGAATCTGQRAGEVAVLRASSERVEALSVRAGRTGWRTLVWSPAQACFLGVLEGSDGWFRFDPARERIEQLGPVLERGRELVAHQRPTLALQLRIRERLWTLAAGPGVLAANGRVNTVTSLVALDGPSSGRVVTRGVLRLDDGRIPARAESLLLAGEWLYTVPWLASPTTELRRLVHDLSKHDPAELVRFPFPST